MNQEQKEFHQWALENLNVRTIIREPKEPQEQGRRMTKEMALELQKEMVRLEKLGWRNYEIADKLGVGRTTVRNHSRRAKENGFRR